MKKMDLGPEDFSDFLGNGIFNLMFFPSKPIKKDWGYKVGILHIADITVDLCFILAGGKCTRHYHEHLYNNFTVLAGELNVYFSAEVMTLSPEIKRAISISPGVKHNFVAKTNVILLETYGCYNLSVDKDIIRDKDSEGGIIDE